MPTTAVTHGAIEEPLFALQIRNHREEQISIAGSSITWVTIVGTRVLMERVAHCDQALFTRLENLARDVRQAPITDVEGEDETSFRTFLKNRVGWLGWVGEGRLPKDLVERLRAAFEAASHRGEPAIPRRWVRATDFAVAMDLSEAESKDVEAIIAKRKLKVTALGAKTSPALLHACARPGLLVPLPSNVPWKNGIVKCRGKWFELSSLAAAAKE